MSEIKPKGFDRTDFWKFELKFDWKNYLIDIPFLIFSIFFFVTKAKFNSVSVVISPEHFALAFCFVVLAIAWNAGNIYARYEAAYSSVFSILVRIALVIFGFMFIFDYWLNIADTWTEGEGTVIQKFIAYFSVSYLFLIPAAFRSGLMTGRKKITGTDNGILKFNAKLFCFTLAIVSFILISLLYWDADASNAHQLIIIIAVLAVPILGGIILYKSLKGIWHFFNKSIFGKLFSFFQEIIIPLLIGTSLAIYFQTGFYNIHLYNQVLGGMTFVLELRMLCVSAILPMKLFFMLSPPMRFYNLLFSLLALVLLLISIH
jgi:hypothetical protein